jgi:hypothetical protein
MKAWIIGPAGLLPPGLFMTSHSLVMPGLVPGIHVFVSTSKKTWMAGLVV